LSSAFRARAATVGILALIFGAGVLSGVAGDRLLGSDTSELQAGVPEGTPPRPDMPTTRDAPDAPDARSTEGRSNWLIHRVDLSDVQRVQVDSVLEFYRARIRELTDTYNEAYWGTVQSTRDELRAILDEDQRIRYDSLLARNDRRRDRDPDN
jgi:hypothetical protein